MLGLSGCDLKEISNHHLLFGRFQPVSRVLFEIPRFEHMKVETSIPHLFIYITDNRAVPSDINLLADNEVLMDIYKLNSFFGDVIAFRRLSCITDSLLEV